MGNFKSFFIALCFVKLIKKFFAKMPALDIFSWLHIGDRGVVKESMFKMLYSSVKTSKETRRIDSQC